MVNINDFTTQTPVLALQKAMQAIRESIESSFEDQLFIALLTAVQGKASDDSIVYLSELIDVNAHTKKCLVDASLVESLSKKGFLSAIRKNRQFWVDVLAGNILKFEVEDRLNDVKAKLCMHNRSLLELCMLRLEAEKAENAEKLAKAQQLADAKQARKEKRIKEKQLLEAKLAEQEYQEAAAAQAKQLQLVEEQVQTKLQLIEAYAVEDAVQRALEYQATQHADQLQAQATQHADQLQAQATEHADKLQQLASPDGILSLIEQLDDTQRLDLLTMLAAKYPTTAPTTKRGKRDQASQGSLIS